MVPYVCLLLWLSQSYQKENALFTAERISAVRVRAFPACQAFFLSRSTCKKSHPRSKEAAYYIWLYKKKGFPVTPVPLLVLHGSRKRQTINHTPLRVSSWPGGVLGLLVSLAQCTFKWNSVPPSPKQRPRHIQYNRPSFSDCCFIVVRVFLSATVRLF